MSAGVFEGHEAAITRELSAVAAAARGAAFGEDDAGRTPDVGERPLGDALEHRVDLWLFGPRIKLYEGARQ